MSAVPFRFAPSLIYSDEDPNLYWLERDELIYSDEDPNLYWLERDDRVPDPAKACEMAAAELGVDVATLHARPVLMREQSEVEARIEGCEFPYMVECTTRARSPLPYWRIEVGTAP